MKKNRFTESLLRLRTPLIVLASAGFLLLLFSLLRISGDISEWTAVHISQYLIGGAAHVTSLLPFSLFEFFVIAAILTALFLLVFFIVKLCKKRFFFVVKGVTVTACVVVFALSYYQLTAGFAYNRDEPVLPLSETMYLDGAEVQGIATYFMDDFERVEATLNRDEKGNTVCPYSFDELCKLIREEFKRLDAVGNGYYYSYTPKAKKVLNSWFMMDTGITGVAFMPTGEANINTLTPASSLPHTIAHELAHTKGVMREYQANLIADYILLTSTNSYLRYCGYYSAMYELRSMVSLSNPYEYSAAMSNVFGESNEKLKALSTEYRNASQYWKDFKGPIGFLSDTMEKIGEFFNNLYLKSQGQEDGTGSYYENPDSEIVTDPITEIPTVTYIKYTSVQKMFFALYEGRAS